MKRIMAMVIFQTRRDAERAADALDEAAMKSATTSSMCTAPPRSWRHGAMLPAMSCAACAALLDELNVIVHPFEGIADEAGVFAEGEHHGFGDPPRIGLNWMN